MHPVPYTAVDTNPQRSREAANRAASSSQQQIPRPQPKQQRPSGYLPGLGVAERGTPHAITFRCLSVHRRLVSPITAVVVASQSTCATTEPSEGPTSPAITQAVECNLEMLEAAGRMALLSPWQREGRVNAKQKSGLGKRMFICHHMPGYLYYVSRYLEHAKCLLHVGRHGMYMYLILTAHFMW